MTTITSRARSDYARTVLEHITPTMILLAALATLVVTPFLALRQSGQPFIGGLLEPTMVVAAIDGHDWPLKDAGIDWPQRLVAVEGQPAATFTELQAALRTEPFRPVALTFEDWQPGRPRTSVTISPIPLQWEDLLSLFVIPWIVGAAFWGIGVWVYVLRGHARAGRAFVIFCAALTITTAGFFDMNSTHAFAVLWAVSIPIAATGLFHLALVFPAETGFVRRYAWLRFAPWLPGVVLVVVAVQALFDPTDPWRYIATWLTHYQFAALGLLFFLGGLLFRLFRSDSPAIRQQSRIILFGAALAFGPVFILFLIPSALGTVQRFVAIIYFPPMVLFPLSTAYAIVRYRLLDVDRAFSKAVVYGVMTLVVVGTFVAVLNAASLLLGRRLAADDPILLALFVFLLALLFNPLRDYAQRLVDGVFYRSQADYPRLLQTFGRDLTQMPDLQAVLDTLFAYIDAGLKPSEAWAYLFDEDGQQYVPYGSAWPLPEATFNPEGHLARTLRIDPQPIYVLSEANGVKMLGMDWHAIAYTSLRLFIPLLQGERLSGWIALGPRLSEEPYSESDLGFLSALANQSALALENARLFAHLRRTLAETMRMKGLMDSVFASIASGVLTTDVHDKVILFNRAAERILGIPAASIIGRPYDTIGVELGARIRAYFEQVKVEQTPVVGEEITTDLPGRGAVNLRLSLSPLQDAQDSTVGIAMVLDDLTAQRALEKERTRIKRTFESVVTPSVVDKLLSDPQGLQLGGQRQEITTLFADVRNFTTFSERSTPEVLMTVLNQYLSLAGQAVLEQEGTLDKFMGDAVMALFNAPIPQPDHTLRAVRAALTMRETLEAHRSLLDSTHRLYFGVGITVGEAVVGNVGTPELFNYTAMGDCVNLAKRLQENAAPGQILIHAAAYERVKDVVRVQKLPPLQVKGRRATETVYEIVGLI